MTKQEYLDRLYDLLVAIEDLSLKALETQIEEVSALSLSMASNAAVSLHAAIELAESGYVRRKKEQEKSDRG